MKLYGLVGFPLRHSFSAEYFAKKFTREGITGTVYRNFELQSLDLLDDMLDQNPDLCGFNVTIPFKQQIIELLDSTEGVAGEIGAVNTVRIQRVNNRRLLSGYNTDVTGFRVSLLRLLDNFHDHALVLGKGGSSLAVAFVLNSLGIPFRWVTRNPGQTGELHYNDLTEEIMHQHKLIINSTPLGMFPNIHSSPDIPYEHLQSDHILFDLVYNPPETEFLKKGARMGCRVKNGLEMLGIQAEEAWKIWNV